MENCRFAVPSQCHRDDFPENQPRITRSRIRTTECGNAEHGAAEDQIPAHCKNGRRGNLMPVWLFYANNQWGQNGSFIQSLVVGVTFLLLS